MRIEPLTTQNFYDLNKVNQPFEIIGRIHPELKDGKWSSSEEIYEHPYWKQYPDDRYDASYIDSDEKTAFLAYLDTECVGQIVLRKDWTRYAFIEDLGVCQSARGQGVGTALLTKAAEWAQKSSLDGLALETQDNNLLACRFYRKFGFQIGAVNTMLYKNFEKPWCEEIAVFWYLKF